MHPPPGHFFDPQATIGGAICLIHRASTAEATRTRARLPTHRHDSNSSSNSAARRDRPWIAAGGWLFLTSCQWPVVSCLGSHLSAQVLVFFGGGIHKFRSWNKL